MAIVSKYGKPDLFITFTCNPKCKDITNNLPAGQSPEHRPDIVTRVFKQHVKELLHDLTVKHVLGVPVAHVHVIEFQKRGLPHVHMLIILTEETKLREASDIDSTISAEIPNPETQPQLYAIVKKSMVHGPCGVMNKNSVCMADGSCTKDYPKEFREATVLSDNGYPLYKRRDNGRTIAVGNHEVDNRWIVPYNPYLTQKFDAHINVEACTSIKIVKYLFKYIYKGHDCANIEMTATDELNHDEVSTFIDARYVSAPEAFWRLSEYELHNQSHTIIRLPIHLPQQQPVIFQPGQHEQAVQRAANQNTMLTAYSHYYNNYTYSETPLHFVFNKSKKEWQPRKRGSTNIIPRMYSVSPKDMERYCLRLLLLHVPGATSFEDLRRFNGYFAPTFKEACLLRSLLQDDTEWHRTMEEASTFQMPAQIRSLFATICTFCDPSDPVELWNTFKPHMIEDYLLHHQVTQDSAEIMALAEINRILEQHGQSCSSLGLPFSGVAVAQDDIDVEQSRITSETNMALLNNQQKALVDEVLLSLRAILQKQPLKTHAYFLDGPGGSGKTLVYNTLISWFHWHGLKVASTAWTGIAATLLIGGQTCHSLFKLPVPILDTSVCHVSPTSKHADFLRNVDMFIIDEASMVPIHALSAIDKMLRDITNIDVPFGGKIFLLGGDFRQVLPVVPRRPRTVIVENCLKSSPLWPLFTTFRLTKNMRAYQDQQGFAEWLLALGAGELKCEDFTLPPDTIPLHPHAKIVDGELVEHVFPDFTNPKGLSNSIILTPTNESALLMNNEVLKKMPGEEKVYLSADKALCDDEDEANNFSPEFLHSITPSGMPLTDSSSRLVPLLCCFVIWTLKRDCVMEQD